MNTELKHLEFYPAPTHALANKWRRRLKYFRPRTRRRNIKKRVKGHGPVITFFKQYLYISRKMLVLYALLLFTAVSLIKNTADGSNGLEFEDSDDEYCTDDDCEDDDSSLELYLDSSKQGQSWLSYFKDTLSSATGVRNVLNVLTGLKGVIDSARKFIMYNLNQKYEKIYNTTAELVYEAKEIIMHNLDKSYEQLYKYYEEIKNTTREFGQKVYDKAANFSERVRVVFREEFNNFLETIWEYGLGESVANGKSNHHNEYYCV